MNKEPKWTQATLLSYTIVATTAFYNRRSQEDINMDDWDSDIVANKKEIELFFIPSVHLFAKLKKTLMTSENR